MSHIALQEHSQYGDDSEHLYATEHKILLWNGMRIYCYAVEHWYVFWYVLGVLPGIYRVKGAPVIFIYSGCASRNLRRMAP